MNETILAPSGSPAPLSNKRMANPQHLDFLQSLGVDKVSHSGRTFLQHLQGTCDLLETWGCEHDVCVAGLFHSVYGTQKFKVQSVSFSERDRVKSIIGGNAEALAYLFCVSERSEALLSALKSEMLTNRLNGSTIPVSRSQILQLIEIESANLIEQGSGRKFFPQLLESVRSGEPALRERLLSSVMQYMQQFLSVSAGDEAAIISDAVEKSLVDRDRLCPVFAGSALIRGNSMIVRLPGKEARIKAPAVLLNQLYKYCDGRRSFNEIVEQSGKTGRAAPIADFMRDLLRAGILVDAANWLAGAAKVAHSLDGWGRSAEASVWQPVSKRAEVLDAGAQRIRPLVTRLAESFKERISAQTFGDAEVTEAAVGTLLWAMYGAVSDSHPRRGTAVAHRTVASAGGFYCLDFHVVLLRAAGSLTPGVYRIGFCNNGEIGFRLISEDAHDCYRAFSRPGVLDQAAGVVVISANIAVPALKYCNRAFQYLLLEAGEVLQNAALVASELGLAQISIGDFVESRITALCEVPEQSALATLVFGSRPTHEQVLRAQQMLKIESGWVEDIPELPLHLAWARVDCGMEKPIGSSGWGRDNDPAIAYRKAVSEAIERYALRVPQGLVTARMTDLSNAIDPRSIIAYSASQYRRAQFPFYKFDPRREHRWKIGQDCIDGRDVFVLADCVYEPLAFDEEYRGHLYTRPWSSGCASATTRDEAILRATLELIERDAFMRHWFAQSGGTEIILETLSDAVADRVGRLISAGCRVSMQYLASPFAFVVMVIVQHKERHFTCIGAAASLDPSNAITVALAEAETLAYVRLHEKNERRLKPKDVRVVHDHADLYRQMAYFQRADALFDARERKAFEDAAKLFLSPVDIFKRLGDQFGTVVWVDLSIPGASLWQSRSPIFTVRVIVPGLVPMTFGYGCYPLHRIQQPLEGSLFPHPFN